MPPNVEIERTSQSALTRVDVAANFTEIYREHAAFVFRTARRLGVELRDVEDVCQEVFVVAYRKASDFSSGSLRAWLFAITQRVARDHRQRAHRRYERPSEHAALSFSKSDAPDAFRVTAARELLDEVLSVLDDDKRAVFILFELERMDMAEVAEAVECSIPTAYARHRAARVEAEAALERLSRAPVPEGASR